MAEKEDVFSSFEETIGARSVTDPWLRTGNGQPNFEPDYELLQQLMAIPIAAGSDSATGRLAKAIDAWVAHELRRARFDPDEVWPRLTRPRVLTRELVEFIKGLPKAEQEQAWRRVASNTKAAPSSADVLGRAYFKQVDVLVAHWSRGPELLISTKSMVSSFGNNRKNRFEEAYGDAKNLRGRYPLLSMGFLFVVRSTIPASGLELTIDMMRKLQAEQDIYDSTALVLVEWSDDDGRPVRVRNDLVPEDLQAGRFLGALIGRLLERTPISIHVPVREAREGRHIELDE